MWNKQYLNGHWSMIIFSEDNKEKHLFSNAEVMKFSQNYLHLVRIRQSLCLLSAWMYLSKQYWNLVSVLWDVCIRKRNFLHYYSNKLYNVNNKLRKLELKGLSSFIKKLRHEKLIREKVEYHEFSFGWRMLHYRLQWITFGLWNKDHASNLFSLRLSVTYKQWKWKYSLHKPIK